MTGPVTDNPTPPTDLPDLARYSARIGADPLLIQGAGGNTSIKDGDVMWIKASGTVLADALSREIFVPVDLPAIRASLDDPAIDADAPAQFALETHGLRPSIETCLHAVFPQRVVVHAHCVQTLAVAVRTDAEDILGRKLAGFDYCAVPYARPGAHLAAMVRDRLGPATNVAVLLNHGLIVAADTVAQADALLEKVTQALTVEPQAFAQPDIGGLRDLAGPGWVVPEASAPVHQVALSADRVRRATGGSLYPDHVIFCGVGATAVDAGSIPAAAASPPMVIVPGMGALVRADASSGAVALAQCLGDVLMRVPPDAELIYLTPGQNAELLGWDAEKYRQSLNA